MGKNKMIETILKLKCFEEKPPVLVDVGASGGLHQIWKKIAKNSICIAFEPDEREVKITNKSVKDFKSFIIINRIVCEKEGIKSFHLTKSPFCSSCLKTDLKSLSPYDIKSYFEIEKKIKLKSTTINSVLKTNQLNYIDWFKTDSQGTDLRIYSSITPQIRERILVAEFEPGIMDAYIGEDKLYGIMEFFNNKDFWCDECRVKGMRRLKEETKKKYFRFVSDRLFNAFLKPSAFWAEISYTNQMRKSSFDKRDYLLMIVFAILKKQYGFAIEIAEIGKIRFKDKIFNDIIRYCIVRIRRDGYLSLPFYVFKKLFLKYFQNV